MAPKRAKRGRWQLRSPNFSVATEDERLTEKEIRLLGRIRDPPATSKKRREMVSSTIDSVIRSGTQASMDEIMHRIEDFPTVRATGNRRKTKGVLTLNDADYEPVMTEEYKRYLIEYYKTPEGKRAHSLAMLKLYKAIEDTEKFLKDYEERKRGKNLVDEDNEEIYPKKTKRRAVSAAHKKIGRALSVGSIPLAAQAQLRQISESYNSRFKANLEDSDEYDEDEEIDLCSQDSSRSDCEENNKLLWSFNDSEQEDEDVLSKGKRVPQRPNAKPMSPESNRPHGKLPDLDSNNVKKPRGRLTGIKPCLPQSNDSVVLLPDPIKDFHTEADSPPVTRSLSRSIRSSAHISARDGNTGKKPPGRPKSSFTTPKNPYSNVQELPKPCTKAIKKAASRVSDVGRVKKPTDIGVGKRRPGRPKSSPCVPKNTRDNSQELPKHGKRVIQKAASRVSEDVHIEKKECNTDSGKRARGRPKSTPTLVKDGGNVRKSLEGDNCAVKKPRGRPKSQKPVTRPDDSVSHPKSRGRMRSSPEDNPFSDVEESDTDMPPSGSKTKCLNFKTFPLCHFTLDGRVLNCKMCGEWFLLYTDGTPDTEQLLAHIRRSCN